MTKVLVLWSAFTLAACDNGTGPVPPNAFGSIASGFLHACAVLGDGTAYCWGRNVSLQLGTGQPNFRDSVPVPVAGGLFFAQLDGGQRHTCGLALTSAGYCWGSNSRGQLGDGTGTDALTPAPVAGGFVFRMVTAGDTHTCALTGDAVAYCWGYGPRLGIGTLRDTLRPAEVAGNLRFMTISAGDFHTCALTQSGAAYCWGDNIFGQLGIDSAAFTLSPVRVAEGLTFTALSLGNVHSCGLTTDHEVYCWGSNVTGQLGKGSIDDRAPPTRVSGNRAYRMLSAGASHTCALTTSNAAYCWGNNAAGQLGISPAPETCRNFGECATTPVAVSGGHRFRSVSGGGIHTCAIDVAHQAFCWGSDSDGQLGIGEVGTPVYIPVRVSSPRP